MFSSRVPGELDPNRLARAVRRLRAAGVPLLDLTVTNPTSVGIGYPPSILSSLADPAALRYEPAPLGRPEARAAIARDYERHGTKVAPDRIVLTASTSEAYSVLFKLLCGPDWDAVMLPVPSYPLFDHLTRLDGVRSIPYRLEYQGRWEVDLDTLDAGWTDTVRAALVVDEVFVDYPLSPRQTSSASRPPCLTFRLGGLSKSAGLPQVKLGWIVVEGPDALVQEALERLELICDTYLSVSTPVQVAAPALIAAGATVRAAILARVRGNDDALRTLAAGYPSIQVLPSEAGWSAVLRVPSTRSEEDLVLELLGDGVLVHPGFFFDFAHESFLVVSLLPETTVFTDGVRRVMERAHA